MNIETTKYKTGRARRVNKGGVSQEYYDDEHTDLATQRCSTQTMRVAHVRRAMHVVVCEES